MADMTAKHHRLIQDAVAKGISQGVKRLFGCWQDGWITQPKELRMSEVVNSVTDEVCESLATSLAYTHDRFEGSKFKIALRDTVKQFIEGSKT